MAITSNDLQRRLLAVQGHYLESRWMPAAFDESALLRSWGRCQSAGLRPGQRIEFDTVGRARQAEVDDRYGRFARAARPEMDRLLQSFNQSDYAVLLASPEGVLIDALGHPDNQSLRLKTLARRGVDIGEKRVGTTAPSVVASEWQAQLVHADAHYCEDNRVFFCVAAPIEGPQGEHLAVIDVTGCERVPQFDALGLVREAAVAIENLLFMPERDQVLLRFHHRPESIGTPAEAIVGVAADGRIVSANRAALRYLNRTRAELQVNSFEMLFGRRFAPLLGRNAAAHGVELHLVTGLVVHAVVETGSAASAAADATPADTAPPVSLAAPEAVTAPTMRDMELEFMRQTLERCGGNVSRAARLLGVSRNTIYRRLAQE